MKLCKYMQNMNNQYAEDCLHNTNPSWIKSEITMNLIYHYLNDHYKHGSLKDFSLRFNYPEYYVCKFVKKETNHTFIQLLQEVRLSKAEYLLRTTPLSIKQIAECTGYVNRTYFYRIFKEKYGFKPKEYRNIQNLTFQ